MHPSPVLVVAAAALAISQVQSPDPPDRPETPFRIFVFAEPQGDREAVARVRKAEDECKKTVKRRKEWFVAVESREQAEIVMEIGTYWVYEELRTESSPLSGTPVNVTRESHHLLAEVNVLGRVNELRAEDGRRLTGAASKLMDALEELCRKDYWEILRRRDPG